MNEALTTTDQERVQELVGALRGAQLGELDEALTSNRDGVLILAEKIARSPGLTSPPAVFVAAMRRGEHKMTMRRGRKMSDDEGTGPKHPARVPAAEALRRLYDAKTAELVRCGVPERVRIPFAVDYACGEIWRCSIDPMPAGGIVQLEDDLYRSLGFDRATGVRFPAPGSA